MLVIELKSLYMIIARNYMLTVKMMIIK